MDHGFDRALIAFADWTDENKITPSCIACPEMFEGRRTGFRMDENGIKILDSEGRTKRVELSAAYRERKSKAIQMCRECPALAECRKLLAILVPLERYDTDGLPTGILAGEEVPGTMGGNDGRPRKVVTVVIDED
jgi:hypothetical protein